MKKEDLRVLKTKKTLKDQFKKMLLEKDYDEITVKDLCEKCFINRRTFYLHYSSLENILEEIQKEYALEFYNRIKDFDHIKEIDRTIREYFMYSEEKGLIFEKININPDFDYIRLRLVNMVANMSRDNFKSIDQYDIFTRNIILTFVNVATVNSYREWIKSGRKLSMDSVIHLTVQLVKNGVSSL